MLVIEIPPVELWDERLNEFVSFKGQTLHLEHSLISISKWESKWHKPFLDKTEKAYEETIDYVKCMTLTQNVNPDVYRYLTQQNIKQINDYIQDSMTASSVTEDKTHKSTNEFITSELIYYWMICLNIPFECQKWHLNRLLMLIRISNAKNQKPKKMSKRDLYSRHAAINAANKKRLNTKG